MEADGVLMDADDAERAVFVDAWVGKTRRPSSFRSWNCSKQGVLSQENVETITSVTFLSADEVKNIELVFQYAVEAIGRQATGESRADASVAGVGKLHYVKRLVPTDGEKQTAETAKDIIALTTAQLRLFLPELRHNVFLDRMVRVFSESGEQLLTLVELIDLYSTMSPRAPRDWKTRACFCMFDFDEDNKLGARDLVRVIGRMVQGTHRTSNQRMSKEDAAVSIQRLYRGFQERSKSSQNRRSEAGGEGQRANVLGRKNQGREGGPRHDSASIGKALKSDTGKRTKLDSYALKMAEDCHSVQADAMDYPYFAQVMNSYEDFRDNFCITPINISDLKQRHGDYVLEASGEQALGNLKRAWLSCMYKADGADVPGEPGEPVETELSYSVITGQNEDSEEDDTPMPSPGWPASPASPRLLSDASAEQVDDNRLRTLGEKIWKEHIASRRLSRLDGTMNVDGSLSYDEAVQMLVQHVLTVDGKLQKKLLPTGDGAEAAPSAYVEDWLPEGSTSPRHRVGDGSVSKEDWVHYLITRATPAEPAQAEPEPGLVGRGGYPDRNTLWRNLDRIMRLHKMWPHWTGEDAPETRKAPRWVQDRSSSYHEEPALRYDAAKQLFEKLWMTEWRHLRADNFCSFHQEVAAALRAAVGQNVAGRIDGKRRAALGAEKVFDQWDNPKCGGLSKKELAEGVATILTEHSRRVSAQDISHQVDMLMYLIVDLDPHGPGYVPKTDFCNFFDLDDDKVRAMAEAVVSIDLSSSRDIVEEQGTREREKVGRNATELSYDGEVQSVRADLRSIYVWTWPTFDKLFALWWTDLKPSTMNAHEGTGFISDNCISLVQLMKAWVSEKLTDRMIRVAHTVNKDLDSRMCQSLWQKMDENNSGSILFSDAKTLIGNHIVCEHGHHFMALNARGRDTRKHESIRKLFNRAMLELHLTGLSMQITDELEVFETNIWRTQTELNRRETMSLGAAAAAADTRAVDARATSREHAATEHQQVKRKLESLKKQQKDWNRMRKDIHGQLNQLGDYDPAVRDPEISETDMPKKILIDRINKKTLHLKKRKAPLQLDDTKDYRAFAECARAAGISELELEVADLHMKTSMHRRAPVSRTAFENWWGKQRWLVKEFTYKFDRLEKIWRQMVGTTGEEGLRVWKVQAILTVLWDVERDIQVSVKARSDFHRRLIAWLHEYDRDNTGKISMDQFGIWFVVQSHDLVKRAAEYPWEDLEIRFDRDAMMDEFTAMLAEVERNVESIADVDTEEEKNERRKMSDRELELEEMLGDLDAEIHSQGVGLANLNDDRLKTREAIDNEIGGSSEIGQVALKWIKVKKHQTAYGVLSGGSRQPLLRARLKLLRKLRSEKHQATLAALQRGDSTKSFCGRLYYRTTKEEVKTDHALLKQSAYGGEEGVTGAVATETVGEMMGDFFHTHKVRCCCDTYWVHDLKLWGKTHVVGYMERTFNTHLHALERSFGYGVSEILRRAKFMIWMNFGLSIIWLGGVIVPRDYRDGHGLWNTTRSVLTGIFDDSMESQGSLFYDGYTKEAVYWPPGLPSDWLWDGFPVRIDLLYFVCILLHVAMSLYTVIGRLGISMDKMASGTVVQEDSESRKCAKMLGMYAMCVPNESDEMRMRQSIRTKLDRWLQAHSEEMQEQAMAWNGENADWKSRFKFLAYETKLLTGLFLTGLVLVMHVGALSWTLINEGSFAYPIIPSLIISVLNVLVPLILKKIIRAEKRIRQTDEVKALMYRIYAFKLIQLAVIMYSLGKISVAEEGSIYKGTKSQSQCPERQFGTTFLRLTCTDAVVFLVTQYGYLYAVNYGLPKPNWKSVVWFFQTRADRARHKVFLQWRPCRMCCWKIRPEESKLVPGRVAGTSWEIRAAENGTAEDGFEFVNIWTGDVFSPSRGKKMPKAVRKALQTTYRLQKRTWNPPPLSLAQRLSGEHHEREHQQWWMRHHHNDKRSKVDVVVTFDPAHGWNGTMPIEFDFSSMYRKRGCCRKHVARSPTIKRISDASCGLDDGLLDMLRPGMKLLQVDEDRKGALSELSLTQLLGLLEDNTEKISLRFEAVNVVQKMEAWATSQVMHHLTAGTLRSHELDMLAQLLVDAGYGVKEDITRLPDLTPTKLYHKIRNRRGKHRYVYESRPTRHKKTPADEPLQTSSLLEAGRHYTSVLHMVKMEPICKLCTKTVACSNLTGGQVPEWCKPCATSKVQGITSTVAISRKQFRKYDTERGGHGTQLDEAELAPLLHALGVDDFRGLAAEGLGTNGDKMCDITEFSAWFDRWQRRKALESLARSCGVPEEQICINSDGWRQESDPIEGRNRRTQLDDELVALTVEQSVCHYPHVAFDDGLERPVLCDQACYVVLNADAKSPELSFVLPKVDPQMAFDSLGVADLNRKSLQSLFKAMGVSLPGRDGKFTTDAINEMSGSQSGAVSFASFGEWWKTKGARQVLSAQSRATGRVQMSKCKSVTTRQGGVDRLHIVVDVSDRIFTFAVQQSEEAMRAEAIDADNVPWSELLPAVVPKKQHVVNWGPDMQARTDRAIENHHLSSSRDRSSRRSTLWGCRQRRDRSMRAAEQHVRNAYDFCVGAAVVKSVMLREIFDQFDHDKSGELDVEEVKRLLKQLRTPAEIGHADVKVKFKKGEVDAIIKQIEDADGKGTSRNKMIEFDEFSAWWEKRVRDRREKGLVEEHWSELRGRAALEFAAAIDIYNDMESRLKSSLSDLFEKHDRPTDVEAALSAKHFGAGAREADFHLLFKKFADEQGVLKRDGALTLLTHIRLRSDDPKHKHAIYSEAKRLKMWTRMEKQREVYVDFPAFETWWEGRSAHHLKQGLPAEYWTVEDEKRAKKLEDERVSINVMEISDLRDSAKENGLGEEAQHIIDEVVLAREKRDILVWCQKAEQELSNKTIDLVPKRKATNRTQALRCYEEALRLDETNPRLQERVETLTKEFNRATQELEKEKIRVFATQLIKYSGEWSEVTGQVNEQRLFKPQPRKIDAEYCAQLLIDIISRQSFVWVGSTWCPWLPAVAFVLQILMFWALSNAMSGIRFLNLAPQRALVSSGSDWSAAETRRIFMTLSLGALFACAIPQLIWLNAETTCGPHSAQDYEDDDGNIVEGTHAAVFETVSVYLQWLEGRAKENGDSTFFASDEVTVIGSFFFNPIVLLIIICLLWMDLRYYRTHYHLVANELQKANKAAEVEKKNFIGEHKELIRRTVDTQTKYGNAVRQHLIGTRQGNGSELTPEEATAARGARTATYNKNIAVLAQQMQHEHDNRQLSVVNEATDDLVKAMFSSCRMLQGATVEFDSLAAAQPMLELASSLQASSGENTDDLANMLVGLSTLFIANISASFATENHVIQKVRGWTGENAVLACTVHRVSDSKGGAEAGGKYTYPSWALVTFVSQSYMDKVLGKMRTAPPASPELQDIRGSWHAIPWARAQRDFPELEGLRGDLSVSENGGGSRNGVHVEAHNHKLRRAMKNGDALFNPTRRPEKASSSVVAATKVSNPMLNRDEDDDDEDEADGSGRNGKARKHDSYTQNATNRSKGKKAQARGTVAVANPMFELHVAGDDGDD